MYESSHIISLNIHHITFSESLDRIMSWGLQHQQGFVCFANVHMTIEARDDRTFRSDLKKALLVLPDGKPLALACRWLYKKKQERISGMDFMPALLEKAAGRHVSVFLYGSTEDVLKRIAERIYTEYPTVKVAGYISPAFRKLSDQEINEHISLINESGAHFVLIALGCPKQEKWMAAHYTAINAVLLGVGGAFPVMAGIKKRAPKWMQQMALEWLYRLLQEPGRMYRRYFYTNIAFIGSLGKEFFKSRKPPLTDPGPDA